MVRLSSLDGQPVYSYEDTSERGRRSRNRWPVFRDRNQTRSERSTYAYNGDVHSQTSRRTAHNLLYGEERGSSTRSTNARPSHSYGGGGHMHTRYNPTRSFGDDVYSTTERSQRSRRSHLSSARTLMSHVSRQGGRSRRYAAQSAGSARTSRYLDEGALLSEVDYSKRTYPRFVLPGWAHMVVGLFLITVAIIDIAWTSVKYENNCEFKQDSIHNPCAAENIYTYVAAPLWGGLAMLMVGALTFTMTPMRMLHHQWMLALFIGGCFFLFLIICPAIISLGLLNILQNEGTFWSNVKGRGLVLRDDARFALILVTVILGAIDWLVSILSLAVAFCAPPESQTDFRRDSYSKSRSRSYLDTPTPQSHHNYPVQVVPPLSTDRLKSIDRMSDGGRPKLNRGDVIVHEEVIRPSSGHRSRGTSRYDDHVTLPTGAYRSRDRREGDVISLGDSRYSSDRPRRHATLWSASSGYAPSHQSEMFSYY